jgi:hypothetical protein
MINASYYNNIIMKASFPEKNTCFHVKLKMVVLKSLFISFVVPCSKWQQKDLEQPEVKQTHPSSLPHITAYYIPRSLLYPKDDVFGDTAILLLEEPEDVIS